MKNDKNLRALLRHCDKRFYPYIVKVLNRLPEDVRNKDILLDQKLKIISFDGDVRYDSINLGSCIDVKGGRMQ